MPRSASPLSTIVCGLVLGFANPGLAAAAGTPPGGRSNVIICWTDNNGRQVGCGYTVPPEYANNPTRELNARGVTVKKTEGVLSGEALRLKQEEDARRKAEEQERTAQRRRDQALLNSYTSEHEIDARRDRDVGQIDLTIVGLETHLKHLRSNEADLRKRLEPFSKSGKPAPQHLTEDVARLAYEVSETERHIAQRRSEQEALRARYNEIRLRYLELTRRETPSR